MASLAPRSGETIVDKSLPNAFAGTDLAKHLATSGRKNLIVGGFMTHMCVSATVRSATDNGFMSTLAADTVATRDLPDATGGATITADTINRITLAALADRFAWIVPRANEIRSKLILVGAFNLSSALISELSAPVPRLPRHSQSASAVVNCQNPG